MMSYTAAKPSFLIGTTIIGLLMASGVAMGQPNVSASTAILMDQQTGKVLWSKNPHWQRPIASLTKIMTAILVLENSDLDASLTVSQAAMRTGGSSMYLRSGDTYGIRDLLYGLMLLSGNDAAVALAEYVGGSVPRFVSYMNKKATMLGALNTTFANPHGLPAESHYSTAHDMALITRHALSIPEFATLVASQQARICDPIGGELYSIYNKNRLLWEFAGANGVKTGYTLAAGRCLVASAAREDRQVIAVILDGPQLWEDAKALLSYGLEEYENVLVKHRGQLVGTAGVVGGIDAIVPVVVDRDLWVTIPRGSKGTISIDYYVNSKI
ncbi:MAG: D-alanyl-D-alanine carboxypeptidase, partial [Firmicutes bacterium]|nr:D-alanyl-D-alanine carboxypeptidase [Bacillota bacterium]